MSTWDRWSEEDTENKNENQPQDENNTYKEPESAFEEEKDFDSGNYGEYNNRNRRFDEENDVYKTVTQNGRPKTMGWSVTSMVLGILSLVCCCFGWTGAIFGIGAIVFSIISKKTLGYFDGMSIAGLVCGIFGCVFGASIILTSLLLPEEFFDEFYYEYYNGTNQF